MHDLSTVAAAQGTTSGAGDGRLIKFEGSVRAPKLESCPLLNISVCAASVELSRVHASFTVVAYNPLAWPRTEPVRVPIAALDSIAWQVLGTWRLMGTTCHT